MRRSALAVGIGLLLTVAVPLATPSTAAVPEHLNIAQYDGPETCVACHQTEAEAMHGSVHYQQSGPTPNVLNIPDLAGERGPGDVGMNTYCGAHVSLPFIQSDFLGPRRQAGPAVR